MDVPVLNMQGAEVGALSVDENSLGGTVNPALIKQAYVRYHANRRQGSARTKNRHEVDGTGKKWYRQKGTGRARHGNRKPPHFKGGGHSFAKRKKRESYRLDMPKKMRRQANRNALLAKLVDGEVKVIDTIGFDKPKTSQFKAFMSAIGMDKNALVAIPNDDFNTRMSARNVPEVTMTQAANLNAFDMLNHRYLVISKTDLEGWLNGPSSQTDKNAKVSPMGREGAA